MRYPNHQESFESFFANSLWVCYASRREIPIPFFQSRDNSGDKSITIPEIDNCTGSKGAGGRVPSEFSDISHRCQFPKKWTVPKILQV